MGWLEDKHLKVFVLLCMHFWELLPDCEFFHLWTWGNYPSPKSNNPLVICDVFWWLDWGMGVLLTFFFPLKTRVLKTKHLFPLLYFLNCPFIHITVFFCVCRSLRSPPKSPTLRSGWMPSTACFSFVASERTARCLNAVLSIKILFKA